MKGLRFIIQQCLAPGGKNNIICIKFTPNTEMCLIIPPISSSLSFVHLQVGMQTHEKLGLISHATMNQFIRPRLRAGLEPQAFFRAPYKRDPLKMILFSKDNEKQSNATQLTFICHHNQHCYPLAVFLISISSDMLNEQVHYNKAFIKNNIYHHQISIVKSH